MKILVLGGGGGTTAYYLARDGCEVTVVEAQDGVGREASGSNASILAAGHAFAWASPRAPLTLLRSLLGQQTAIRERLTPDPRLYAWGLLFLRECTAERARRNTLVKLRLSQYSLAIMADLVRRENIRYHAIARGALYLYRDPHELELGVEKMRLLAEHGQRQEVLDPAGVARLDPVFARVTHKIAGGVLDLGDSSGDSQLFTEELARICRERLGVTFHMSTRVRALRAHGNHVTAAVTDRGALTADAYVLALGAWSPIVARTIGVGLPVYPAKGYSSTFPLGRPPAADFDGRVRRLPPGLEPAELREHPAAGRRPLSRSRRLQPRRIPLVPAADDARRSPVSWSRPARESVLQHGARPHGLDHGVRLGAGRGRPDSRNPMEMPLLLVRRYNLMKGTLRNPRTADDRALQAFARSSPSCGPRLRSR